VRNALRAAGKLVLGETWQLPLGVAAAVLLAAALRVAAGGEGWWRHAGGAILAALLAVALLSAVLGSTKRISAGNTARSAPASPREDPVNDVNKA